MQRTDLNYLVLAEVEVFSDTGNGDTNLALGKPTLQSSVIGANGSQNAVDGSRNGNYLAGGALAHTQSEREAWWQVDLGRSTDIRSVKIWNQTGGQIEPRLRNFWVFISDKPFTPSDTPEKLATKEGIFKWQALTHPDPSVTIQRQSLVADSETLPHVLFDNGFLRVRSNTADRESKILNFDTNGASLLTLSGKYANPVLIEYLFWPNDNLSFRLNGHSVSAPVVNGLHTVVVPAGLQHLTLEYRHGGLRIFLFLYAIYGFVVVSLLLIPASVFNTAIVSLRSRVMFFKTGTKK